LGRVPTAHEYLLRCEGKEADRKIALLNPLLAHQRDPQRDSEQSKEEYEKSVMILEQPGKKGETREKKQTRWDGDIKVIGLSSSDDSNSAVPVVNVC